MSGGPYFAVGVLISVCRTSVESTATHSEARRMCESATVHGTTYDYIDAGGAHRGTAQRGGTDGSSECSRRCSIAQAARGT